jgi:hypothetical protein
LLLILVLAVVGAIGSAVANRTQTQSFTMPGFKGFRCSFATDSLDSRVKQGNVRNIYHSLSSPGCGDNVVLRSNPPAGSTVTTDNKRSFEVTWQVIDRDSYNWYTKHKTMPNLVGKSLVRDYTSDMDHFMREVPDTSLVQIQSDGGFYLAGEDKILRTEPKAGARLKMGQQMTVYTQTQRGEYISGSTGSTGGRSNGSGLHFGACVHVGIFHLCS